MDKVRQEIRARTEIRHLNKRERARKAWLRYERDLVNVTRKLTEGERMLVFVCAERFALARIKARLAAGRRPRHGR